VVTVTLWWYNLTLCGANEISTKHVLFCPFQKEIHERRNSFVMTSITLFSLHFSARIAKKCNGTLLPSVSMALNTEY
jgi:hypothetical protein